MKNRAKILAHWLLATVVAGQALTAVAAPCGVTTEPPVLQEAPAIAADVHAGHHMSGSEESADHSAHDQHSDAAACCDGGYCSSNGCFSVPAVSSTSLETGGSWLAVVPAPATYSFNSRVRPALFRPPASA